MNIQLSTVVKNAIISGIEFINETDRLTSLEPLDHQPDILIYPNPSEGIFTVEFPKDYYLTNETPVIIYDIAGKIVLESTFQDSRNIINLIGEKKGMYLMKIGNTEIKKLFLY